MGALAKVAGVSAGGTGSHRIVVGSDAGPFTGLEVQTEAASAIAESGADSSTRRIPEVERPE